MTTTSITEAQARALLDQLIADRRLPIPRRVEYYAHSSGATLWVMLAWPGHLAPWAVALGVAHRIRAGVVEDGKAWVLEADAGELGDRLYVRCVWQDTSVDAVPLSKVQAAYDAIAAMRNQFPATTRYTELTHILDRIIGPLLGGGDRG